jgi:hypothetical protein
MALETTSSKTKTYFESIPYNAKRNPNLIVPRPYLTAKSTYAIYFIFIMIIFEYYLLHDSRTLSINSLRLYN